MGSCRSGLCFAQYLPLSPIACFYNKKGAHYYEHRIRLLWKPRL